MPALSPQYLRLLENLAPTEELPTEEPPREEPWFNFVMEWEEPQRGWGYRRARRRWRQRHERIFRLEKDLGYIDSTWSDENVLPWVYHDWGY